MYVIYKIYLTHTNILYLIIKKGVFIIFYVKYKDYKNVNLLVLTMLKLNNFF